MAIAEDTRKYFAMTMDDAVSVFYRLARIMYRIKKNDLVKKEKILKIEQDAESKKAELQKEYEPMHKTLTEFLKAHKDLFNKPRKKKLEGVGSFGWETDEYKVEILEGEEAKIKSYSDENKLALCRVEIIPDKKAIAEAFAAGHRVPGALYIPKGENPKISFAKIIDETKIPEK